MREQDSKLKMAPRAGLPVVSVGNGLDWQTGARGSFDPQRFSGALANQHRAGCDGLIAGSEALNLPDGNRVHFEPIDCLICFGKRWRGDASDALGALGLEPSRLDGNQI